MARRAFALLLALAACARAAPAGVLDVPVAQVSGKAPPVLDASAEATTGTAPRNAKGRHCPCSVHGARTTARDIDGGVELRVTAAGDAIAEVQGRARVLAEKALPQAAGRHDGKGGGLGFRKCPVVLKDTDVAASLTPDGALLVVRAKNAAEIDWLRRETRQRLSLSAPE